MDHPLDRPIWTALTTRQAACALVSGGIRRFDPAFAPFAASAGNTAESLAGLVALVPVGGQVVLQQSEPIAPPPGLALVSAARTVQMVADRIHGPPADFEYDVLGARDAAAMLALASLTTPGPFAGRTHELGRFLGVRHEGELVAMAGERMKPGAYTEVSGVCTHPDHRGRGYAAGLLREVARAILARGETPFLHAYAENLGAISLYERIGFVTRWTPMLLALKRA
nr:GNAT family N-acetyltransferase [uncultured Lichenicoccus sp.]